MEGRKEGRGVSHTAKEMQWQVDSLIHDASKSGGGGFRLSYVVLLYVVEMMVKMKMKMKKTLTEGGGTGREKMKMT